MKFVFISIDFIIDHQLLATVSIPMIYNDQWCSATAEVRSCEKNVDFNKDSTLNLAILAQTWYLPKQTWLNFFFRYFLLWYIDVAIFVSTSLQIIVQKVDKRCKSSIFDIINDLGLDFFQKADSTTNCNASMTCWDCKIDRRLQILCSLLRAIPRVCMAKLWNFLTSLEELVGKMRDGYMQNIAYYARKDQTDISRVLTCLNWLKISNRECWPLFAPCCPFLRMFAAFHSTWSAQCLRKTEEC